MAKKVTSGSTKRFGPRYGARNRERLAIVEKEHRGRHKCPFCNFVKVKRLSKGIWTCEKCKETFTGKAYTFETKKRKSADLLKKPKAEKIKEEDYADYAEIEEETAAKEEGIAAETEEGSAEEPLAEEIDEPDEEKEVAA
jgi:ribosomal protein eL43